MFEEKRKSGFFRTFLMSLLTSVGVGTLVYFLLAGDVNKFTPQQYSPETQKEADIPKPQQIALEQTSALDNTVTSVAKNSTAGVVGISVLKADEKAIFNSNTSESWGVGSGVIVSPNGFILTNNHVAGGKNKRIIVSLADGRNVDGITVWAEPVLDLAIVKVELSNLPVIPLGDANSLQVGEPAIAIGNPLGMQFQRTVTSGIISALNRTIKIDTEEGTNYMEDLIQTDASINPGNSGGPLLNSRGQVIGINTVKVASAEGIGFAVPINVAKPIINHLANGGNFTEAYMGVFAYDREVIPYVSKNITIDSGVYVVNVDRNGPAYKSGIKVGSVITKIDENVINTMLQLRTQIYSKKPGDTINVTYFMDGKYTTVPVTLDKKIKDGLLTR